MHSKDPLIQNPDAARELFKQLAQVARGFPAKDVQIAAINLLVNAVRTEADSRQKAELAWDELIAKSKEHLMNCYDSTGRKKGIFPYNQHIHVPHIKFSGF
jgi:hypothetical protein